MSKKKITYSLGPWEYDDIAEGGEHIINGPNGKWIAAIKFNTFQPWSPEAYDMGRLIATAPEMFELLKTLKFNFYIHSEIGKRVRDVITKAEGRTMPNKALTATDFDSPLTPRVEDEFRRQEKKLRGL